MNTHMIHPCTSVDQAGWLALRRALWPEDTDDEHRREMGDLLASPERFAQFLAHDAAGHPVGLAEASLRSDYVNGTRTTPVAYLEGLYVAPESRRRGVARDLVAAVARWGTARGCRELASDVALENEASQRFHRALGFEETERVVFFRAALPRERA